MRDIPPRTAAVIVALALIASLVSGGERVASNAPPVAEPAARPAPAPRADARDPAQFAADPVDLDVERLRRSDKQGRVKDLFAANVATPPLARRAPSTPPPAPAPFAAAQPEPAPRPAAPQLPFRYLGHLVEGEKTSVFLERNQEVLSVPVGETLAGSYKVQSISDTAVVFVYLPLGETQTLPIPPRP